MSATTYLILANTAVVLGIGGYLVFMASRSAELKRRVRQIELLGGSDGE